MLKDLYPYLNFNGQAADAMALYVQALGAVVEGDMRWRDLPDHEVPAEMADRVMHGCIRIGGHTDDVGADSDNQQLSEARARAVRDYLVDAGVSAERLEYRGYGESRPVEAGTSDAARAQNRRTTVEVLE